jgi:hypothetical protein
VTAPDRIDGLTILSNGERPVMPNRKDDDRDKRFLGLPYSGTRPTVRKVGRRAWDPTNRHILVPKVFGWGWSLNLAEIARRLHLRR